MASLNKSLAHPHAGFAVLAFLDTEFTDLVIRPRLLSVGVVAERGFSREFYAEVTDQDRIHATGWFGQSAVLPHFGNIAGAACSYAELGERLSLFFGELMKGLRVDEFPVKVIPKREFDDPVSLQVRHQVAQER